MTTPAAADTPSYAISGWFEAAAYVLTIGALSLTYAYGHSLGAHPIAFILYAMLVSAVAMLAYTGFGVDARAIMLHPKSWIVGAAIILIEVFFYAGIGLVSPTHTAVVVRISIPVAMVAGVILLGRRVPPLGIIGALGIVATMAVVLAQTGEAVRWPLAAMAGLAALFMVVRGFASEFHPWNRAAKTVHEKIRVTGLVVLVTAIMSLVATGIASLAIAGGLLPPLAVVPTVPQLLHAPTILLGCFVGGVVLTLMAYLNFSCVVKITTENFTAMMAFTPVATWAAQTLGSAAGIVTVAPVEGWLMAVIAILVACVLTIFWAGRRARRGP